MAVPEFFSGKILYPAIAILIALSALFGLAILPRLTPTRGGLVGKTAPDVTLPVAANGEAGARMHLAELKGHPVLIDFWASWCGPCNVQAPILDRIARRYGQKGVVVLGVNVSDPPQFAREFAVHKGLSYPIVTDEGAEAQKLYSVDQLPTLVVVDKQGQVTTYLTGAVDESSLDEIVAAIL